VRRVGAEETGSAAPARYVYEASSAEHRLITRGTGRRTEGCQEHTLARPGGIRAGHPSEQAPAKRDEPAWSSSYVDRAVGALGPHNPSRVSMLRVQQDRLSVTLASVFVPAGFSRIHKQHRDTNERR
jgi:hypothetical protein